MNSNFNKIGTQKMTVQLPEQSSLKPQFFHHIVDRGI
jgi:hypothetical protein